MARATYTDEQVTTACGLHLDNLRRLITWGAVKPAQSGGGRGRVRLWTLDQAMRIAATAEFTRAGFSLQMAHTLVCCIPMEEVLEWHDPEFITTKVDLSKPVESYMRSLIMPEVEDYWPPDDVIGTGLYILDRALVYGDLTGDAPLLFGVIDEDRNEFHPAWRRPGQSSKRFDGSKRKPLITRTERRNVLVPDFYFTASDQKLGWRRSYLIRHFDSQLTSPEEAKVRSLLRINMAAGLRIAFRKLLGLPVKEQSVREVLDVFGPKEHDVE